MKLSDTPFPSYLAKQSLIHAAWSRCEQRFACLPAPLSRLAADFLQSIADTNGTYRTYFSNPLAPPLLYMPLWLVDGLSPAARTSDIEHVIDILEGTIQGYFYIRIQDDIIDIPGKTDPHMLLFGNACFSGMISAFTRALGPIAGAFWPKLDQIFIEFSQHTLAEQHAVRHDNPYTTAQFDAHADKVAFARTPLLAMAMLSSREDLHAGIGALVHHLGISYGLVNDVIGWPRDVRAEHRTYLLAKAGFSHAELRQIEAIADITIREAKHRAFVNGLRQTLYLDRLVHETLLRAIDEQKRANELAQTLGLRGFDAYSAERIAWLEATDRQALAMGVMLAVSSTQTNLVSASDEPIHIDKGI